MRTNFSHTVNATIALSLVNEAGRDRDRSVIHAKGCTHARTGVRRGAEVTVIVQDFDLATVQADDYFDVSPCAR